MFKPLGILVETRSDRAFNSYGYLVNLGDVLILIILDSVQQIWICLWFNINDFVILIILWYVKVEERKRVLAKGWDCISRACIHFVFLYVGWLLWNDYNHELVLILYELYLVIILSCIWSITFHYNILIVMWNYL